MKHTTKRWLTAVAMYFAKCVVTLAIFLTYTLLIVEWATGCGESYVDSKGKVHTNECVHRSIYKAIKGGH